MERNFSGIGFAACDLMRKATVNIISRLMEKIPENNIGYSFVEFGAIYIEIRNELQDKYGVILEKKDFESFMSENLCEDERVFLRSPVELPRKESDMKDYIEPVFFNNLGEVSPEYVDSYIARFVEDDLIFNMRTFHDDVYHCMYGYDGEIFNNALFALQHFANYDENEMNEVVKKMQSVAKGFNCTLTLVPEDEIYDGTRWENRMHLLIKHEVQ